jgi:hypothetical protein
MEFPAIGFFQSPKRKHTANASRQVVRKDIYAEFLPFFKEMSASI